MECERWVRYRDKMELALVMRIHAESVMEIMLGVKRKWEIVCKNEEDNGR